MLDTRDLYRDYITSVQNKINAVVIKIDQYQGSQEYLRNCIINNKEEFDKVNVNIDTLFANPYIAFSKIKELVDNGQLTRVAHYVKSYVNAIRYLTLHKLLFERYNKCIMPYEVYLKVIGCSNLQIAIHILKGGYYTFGHVGKLFIKEKARTFIYNGKTLRLPVDWGNSNKYKAKLITEGKLPYDQDTAPNGIKWHIYHNTDFAYWFWWEAGPIANRAFFKFFPSKFCKIKQDRRNLSFLKTCKSKDDIYNATQLGNLDKMLSLMRFDPLHFLNYKRVEKNKKVHKVEFVNN